jgi:hypothetical protein
MPQIDELEPQQYGNLYWEEDVPLVDIRKNALRDMMYFGFLLFVILSILGFTVKFQDQIDLPFVVKGETPEEIYRFSSPVFVTGSYIAPGAKIVKGQPILSITSPEIVGLINNYRESKEHVDNYRKNKNASGTKQKEILETKIRAAEGRIDELKRELVTLDNTWKSNCKRLDFDVASSDKNYATNKELCDGKYISRNELKEFEEKKVRSEDARNTGGLTYEKEKNQLSTQLNQALLEIMSINQELSKTVSETHYDSSMLTTQLEIAQNRITNTYGNFEIAEGGLILKASEDGVVSYVFQGEKEVQSGAIVMKIKHSDNGIYSMLSCPPTKIGQLKKDQIVYLKVATYPAFEWGVVKGHLDNLSTTYDERGDFTVKIVMDDYRKLKGMLQPGMTGNASIVMQERSFFGYLVRRMKKAYHAS